MQLIYPNNVKPGDVVRWDITGVPFDVETVSWQIGHGWVAHTRAVDGYAGPTFYPHPDRMPSPDIPSVLDLLIGYV